MKLVEISLNQVPEYLREGDYYKALCEQQDEVFHVPADVLKPDKTLENANDLKHLLASLRFWIVDMTFLLEHLLAGTMDDETCQAIAGFEESIPILRIIRAGMKPRQTYYGGYLAPVALFQYVKRKHVCSAKILSHLAQHTRSKTINDEDLERLVATYSVESVAADGNLVMLKYLFENNITTRSLCYHSARTGQLHCLEYLVSKGSHLFEKTSTIATANGHLHILHFLHRKQKPFDIYCCRIAAENGHLACLKFLHSIKRPWGVHVPSRAALKGHLDCLMYAKENGCPWDASTCCDAATGGHLDCLHYARENGCPWDERTALNAIQHFPCLVYALQNGCPYHATIAKYAFITDYDDSGFYILKHCAGLDNTICTYAAKAGKLDVLQACHDANIPWHAMTCSAAAAAGHTECLDFALARGAPEPVAIVPEPEITLFGEKDDSVLYDLANDMELFFI